MNEYLKEIGYKNIPKVNFETLSELHRLHTLRFPFENLTPFLHSEVKLDLPSLQNKFLTEGRGGYCFEQNTLFLSILKNIGFDVRPLGARVLYNQPEDLITRRSHMLMTVKLDGKNYICDVGFGGMTQTVPIEFLEDQTLKTTHEDFRIGRIGEDFKIEAKVAETWKTLYRFDLQEQHSIDYEVANFYLYTHHSSIFRNNLIAARPVSDGRYALSNTTFTAYKLNKEPLKQTLGSVEEVKEVLTDVFGIKLPAHQDLNARIASVLS